MRVQAVVLAAALMLAPLSARAADLVVWWGGGFQPRRGRSRPRDRHCVRAKSLSIPAALRTTRPEDYAKNAVTLAWPSGVHGQPLAVLTQSSQAAVFRGGHEDVAKEFVRFLVSEGWLAHWLDFAGDRLLPPMPALLAQPFWLNPGDPHRMASAIQFVNQPHDYSYAAVSGEWRHQRVQAEGIWPKAIRRIVIDGLTPEQAADEAIARIKQILSE
jgi:multiple sugar transport system substrate-binding protein